MLKGNSLRRAIELEILPGVNKPGRYTGGELNAVTKTDADLRFALCFPEMYELGMSNTGYMLLYQLLNEQEGVACERSFAPWPDMEQALRDKDYPIYTLETFTPLSEFDIVGFSLSYEMTYSNVLTMLDLGGIPLRASDRTETFPLVIAGGSCTVNPEPMSAFFDAMVVGEGEEVVLEIIREVRAAKKSGVARKKLLERISHIEGVYAPELRGVEETDAGFIVPDENSRRERVKRRYIEKLENAFYPHRCIVPYVEAVHDRINLEIFRGCVRGCRYCQAGMIYRPRRERDAKKLVSAAKDLYATTGWHEMSMLSLNAPDYSQMGELLEGLAEFTAPERISLSMPSTRVDTFSSGVAEKLRLVRGTGLTMAPEAGTQRLRDVINKQVSDDDIETAMRASFRSGWKKVKLYFMIGLPTETTADLDGIVELVERLQRIAAQQKGGAKKGRTDFTLSISNFVPKPHTPFQWQPMDTRDTLLEKQRYLHERLKSKRVKLDFHDIQTSFLEAVFSRGDRRLGDAIEAAWKKGARLDGWSDMASPQTWAEAFVDAGVDAEKYAHAAHRPGAPLPWSHIDSGVTEKFFMLELMKAKDAATTESCITGHCSGCGMDCKMTSGGRKR